MKAIVTSTKTNCAYKTKKRRWEH